jgi:hypothetical protein
MVDDISHEGLRMLLREEGVTFQAPENLESLSRPLLRGKEGRVEQLYAIADREIIPQNGDPEVLSTSCRA